MITRSPNFIDNLFILMSTPDFPIAIITRPQFGSSPAIAVLTNGEFAIEKPITFASCSVLQFDKFIVTNFEAPSPSATILLAKLSNTLFKLSCPSKIYWLETRANPYAHQDKKQPRTHQRVM